METRVQLVGDSWTHIMWNNRTYKDVFDQFGFADKIENGTNTAIGGTTASYWVLPANLAVITSELQSNTSIDIVLLSIGGNDFLAGINGTLPGWHTGLSATDESLLLDRIQTDMQIIINAIKNVRPNIEVVFSGYDYINLVETVINAPNNGALLWANLGQPSALQINTAFSKLEQRKIDIANADPRVHYVNAMGLMQYIYGYPGIFPANLVAFPGQQAPAYSPFPGGDANYPTPPVALAGGGTDAIHLSDGGYKQLVTNQTVAYFHNKFRGGPNAIFVSQGGNNDGWVRSDGNLGTGTIRMGDMSSGNIYRGIISFNTDAIPDNATVTRASLFINRSALSGLNPFSGGFLGAPMVDVKEGSFGAAGIEITDYFTAADAVDAGCFIGNAPNNGYTIRIDFKPSGLSHISKTGLTQFRVYFPNANGLLNDYMDFGTGNQSGLLAPYLDVFYSVPPPLATAVVSGDTLICPGISTVVQVALSGTSPWSITWSDGLTENNIITALHTRIVTSDSTTTYSIVSLSDANGPGSATGNAYVEVKLLPAVIVTGLRSNYCVNSPVSNLVTTPPTGIWSGAGITGNTFNPALAVATMGGGQNTLTYSGVFNSCAFEENFSVIVDSASCNQTGSCNFSEVTGYINCVGGGSTIKTYVSSGNLWVFQDLIPGKIYFVSTCDTCGYDSHLMVRDEADSSFIAENDDACLLQSSVTFVAPSSGKVGVNLTGERNYNCNPYICNPHNCQPYDCNPHNCNPYSCNCQTCYQTCYQDQTVYMTCYPGGIQVIGGYLTSDCIGACTGGFCWRVQYQVPYDCNPYTCNCQTCYNTCFDTCYQTCYDTCYQTCTDKCGTGNNIPCNVKLQCLNCGTPTATVTASNTSLCMGDSVSFTANITGLTCNTQWVWIFGPDAVPDTSTALNPVGVTWTSGGTKQVILQITEPGVGNSSAQLSVSVNPSPSGGILNAAIEACEGDTVILAVDSVLNSSGFYWLSANPLSGSGSVRELVMPDSSVHISVIPYNGQCGGDTFYHTVLSKPSPQVTITANGNTNFCVGDSLSLSASSLQIISLQWQMNEQDITGQKNIYLSVSLGGNYRVEATDVFGCSSFSNEIPVAIYPVPVGTISGNTNACEGDTVSLIASYANASGFQWVQNGAIVQDEGDPLFNITVSGAYSLIASNSFCSDTASSFDVVFHPYPNAIAGSDIAVCAGDSVTLVASGGDYYLWNTGQSGSVISFIAAATADYIVEVSDSFNCTDSDFVTVNVHQNPAPPSLSVSGNTISCSPTVYSSYQWFMDSVAVLGGNDSSLVINSTGYYHLLVIDSNGCTSMSSAIYLVFTGMKEISEKGIYVYPNPANDKLYVYWDKGMNPETISLFNVLGDKVLFLKVKNTISPFETDISNLSQGVYFLQADNKITLRIIKH